MADQPLDRIPDDEIRGVAIAGWTLSMALLNFLIGAKVITDAQADALLEGSLSELESLPVPNDPGVRKTRVLFDALGNAVARQRHK